MRTENLLFSIRKCLFPNITTFTLIIYIEKFNSIFLNHSFTGNCNPCSYQKLVNVAEKIIPNNFQDEYFNFYAKGHHNYSNLKYFLCLSFLEYLNFQNVIFYRICKNLFGSSVFCVFLEIFPPVMFTTRFLQACWIFITKHFLSSNWQPIPSLLKLIGKISWYPED